MCFGENPLSLTLSSGSPESRKPLSQMPAPDSQTLSYWVPSVDPQQASFPACVPHGSQSAQGTPGSATSMTPLSGLFLAYQAFPFSLSPHPSLPLLAPVLCSAFPWLSELVSCQSLLSKPRNTQCGALDKHSLEVMQQPKVSK